MSWLRTNPLLITGALLAGSLGTILIFSPAAGAQDFAEYHTGQTPARPIPGVRYTTGSVTTAGWEKSLTDGDPNLKRWNWAAITSYTQSSYNKVPAGALQKKQPQEAQALRPLGSIYKKPIHISPETYAQKREEPGVIRVGDTSSHADVSGRVSYPKAKAAPAAKSYNSSYNLCGKIKPGQEKESLASRQVYGRLVNTQ
jgi:hypothetical protein